MIYIHVICLCVCVRLNYNSLNPTEGKMYSWMLTVKKKQISVQIHLKSQLLNR